jgi:hypothetical protein
MPPSLVPAPVMVLTLAGVDRAGPVRCSALKHKLS